jgi:hypothetical protein
VASISFSNDASTLVLAPVELMIAKVEMISENPLLAMKMADDEFKEEEMNKFMLKQKMEENTWAKRLIPQGWPM